MFNKKINKRINGLIVDFNNENKAIKNTVRQVIDIQADEFSKINKKIRETVNTIKEDTRRDILKTANENEEKMRSDNEGMAKKIINTIESSASNISIKERKNREELEERFVNNQKNESSRLDKKITDTIKVIEKSILDKFNQLEMFKASEELVGNNPFGIAIANELVKKAFSIEQKNIDKQKNEIKNEKDKIKKEYLVLKNVKSIGAIDQKDIHKRLQELENEKHKYLRQSKNSLDGPSISANSIEHTINYIKNLLKI